MARILNENQIDFATDEEMAMAIASLLETASPNAIEAALERLDEDTLSDVSSIATRIELRNND